MVWRLLSFLSLKDPAIMMMTIPKRLDTIPTFVCLAFTTFYYLYSLFLRISLANKGMKTTIADWKSWKMLMVVKYRQISCRTFARVPKRAGTASRKELNLNIFE